MSKDETFTDMTYQEKLDLLRSEDIKARFVLYGHTVFALYCRIFWTGFQVKEQ